MKNIKQVKIARIFWGKLKKRDKKWEWEDLPDIKTHYKSTIL